MYFFVVLNDSVFKVRKLPADHYATLKYLMHHLLVVSSHSGVNKVSFINLLGKTEKFLKKRAVSWTLFCLRKR